MNDKTIVLTGAAGKLGNRLRLPLAERYAQLRISDILPLERRAPNEEVVQCDLSDAEAVAELVQGADSVVHFGGYPHEAGWDTIVPANILAAINLWEASLKAGVRRIVYASSNHVIGFYPDGEQIGVRAEVKPDSRYGVSKAFAETLGRFYYEKFGLESLGLRIGRCEDEPTDLRMLSTWIHPEDLARMVFLGIDSAVRAEVLYGVSCNARGWWTNDAADLQFQPLHSADGYADAVTTSTAPAQPWPYQGGPFAAAEYVGDPHRAGRFRR